MNTKKKTGLTSIELCAGGGGQALGLELAGFSHRCLIDNDHASVETLKLNRPNWNIIEGDLHEFDGRKYRGVDLVAGGVPCPPFSIAGKQLGHKDERDLFWEALRIVEEAKPRAVMLENVRGLLDPKFDKYRDRISSKLEKLGYVPKWRLLNASDYGVPQLRPRVLMIALKKNLAAPFRWPPVKLDPLPTVGEVLIDLIGANGWKYARDWGKKANSIAPTIVGGSKKQGGPDLGASRAKQAWAELCVNGHKIVDEAPDIDFKGKPGRENMPYLTVRMVARLQGFPDDWHFYGKKTAAYRQVGNAFPPPVAATVGREIAACLKKKR